mmetsp:Transcript_23970/g.29432  ORF Transcript_23970/g.29432 Transcript_23970/m.29432 type:complete len:555 (-) Transcript_23970:42-1706(-)
MMEEMEHTIVAESTTHYHQDQLEQTTTNPSITNLEQRLKKLEENSEINKTTSNTTYPNESLLSHNAKAKECPHEQKQLVDAASFPAKPASTSVDFKTDDNEENELIAELERAISGDFEIVENDVEHSTKTNDILESDKKMPAIQFPDEGLSTIQSTVQTAKSDFSVLYAGDSIEDNVAISRDMYDVEQLKPPPPPSYEDFESEKAAAAANNDLDFMQYGADGNPLTVEEKQKFMEEQIAILEQIKNGESTPLQQGFAGNCTSTTAASQPFSSGAQLAIDIALNKKAYIHDQTQTRKAIANGTAILVQCVGCQNWMQVADNTTLMFCPSCQSVSPVIKQDLIHTKEEALQLMRDRDVAMDLQHGTDSQNSTSKVAATNKNSWKDWFINQTTYPTPTSNTSNVSNTVANVTAAPFSTYSSWFSSAPSSSAQETVREEQQALTVSDTGNHETTNPMERNLNQESGTTTTSSMLSPSLFSCVLDGMNQLTNSFSEIPQFIENGEYYTQVQDGNNNGNHQSSSVVTRIGQFGDAVFSGTGEVNNISSENNLVEPLLDKE